MEILYVWAPPFLVGELRRAADERLSFQYSSDWVENPQSFTLSVSLKLSKDIIYYKEAEFFFANLLPEGNAREALCRKIGISVSNDFELLKQIGRDCAGALVLTDVKNLNEEPPALKEISELELERWLKHGSAGILDLQVAGELRLSLAGAQNKLPFVYKNNKFYQPLGSHPTTHILKPQPERFKYLAENEWFQSHLALRMGLSVAPSKLVKIGKLNNLIVTRYDRHQIKEKWTRLHQEDFCQALGVSGKNKYQKEGGPSLIDCINIINERSVNALEDVDSLLKWQIFNVLIGNCDAHAKNISLLRNIEGRWSLAPFYDLVSTRAYHNLSHQLAMAVSGQYDSGGTHAKHWKFLFKECHVSPARYSQVLIEMADELPEKIKQTKEEFITEYGDLPILSILEKIYHIQMRRLKNGF
jgi:serine/threonine-protein kinase HipA